MGIVIDYTSDFFQPSPSAEKVGTITTGSIDLGSGNVFSDAPSAILF